MNPTAKQILALPLSPRQRAAVERQLGAAVKQPKPPIRLAGFPYAFKSKLERDYAALLERKRTEGVIIAWLYEPVRLRLAGSRRLYTPDFMAIHESGLVTFHECKGPYAREAAMVRLDVAAATYAPVPFFLVRRNSSVGFVATRVEVTR